MPWVVLLISAALEAVWATALGASKSFTVLVPTVVFLIVLVLSMATLAYVTKFIPISTAYAVWAGLGAAFTVGWSMATGQETVSAVRILLLIGVVGCVIGLKLVKGPRESPAEQSS